MRIVLFAHPNFIGSQSMPRYAKWLHDGLEDRGHQVAIWSPVARFFNMPLPKNLKKWMGYVDQYIVFPIWVKRQLTKSAKDTLFVLTDNALGPWVSLVSDRPHVMHCHDFLAQLSAIDMIPENPTSATGKQYQAYIRRGYKKAQNFISISEKTQSDLHFLLKAPPALSKVVYNALTQTFEPTSNKNLIRLQLQAQTGIELKSGFILHVGGNQWYKNRGGIIEIYNSWREVAKNPLPLLLIGSEPDNSLLSKKEGSEYSVDIHFITGKSDKFVKQAYQAASLFLFPSLAEGFGWPILEAMASGTHVVTTGLPPMTEVAGSAATFIHKRPFEDDKVDRWAKESSRSLESAIVSHEDQNVIQAGIQNAQRFTSKMSLDQIESIYQTVLLGQTIDHV